MRILVTGAAGFLGSHLCDRLRAEGHHVCGIDDGSTGDVERLGADDMIHDVRKPFPLGTTYGSHNPFNERFDQIYHLACPASPAHYQKDPKFTIETAFFGTRNVLDAASEMGARVVIASTSEVYGEPQRHPQDEGLWSYVNPIGPRSCYEVGKMAGESLACAYARDVDVRIARIHNTYGPRMNPLDGRVVVNFIAQALAKKPLTVYGDGLQTRSLCYVDDMIDGLVRLMNHDGRKIAGPVNLGNPDELTILDIANAVMLACSMEAGVETSGLAFEPLPTDDPTRRCPDITIARTLLGWSPKTSLPSGLRQTVRAYMRDEVETDPGVTPIPDGA